DLAALELRVAELDAELAAHEGRERGLSAAIAEAELRARAALERRARVDRWRSIRRRLLVVLFTPGGLVLGGMCATGAVPLFALVESSRGIDASIAGTVTSGELAAGTTCTATVRDDGDGRCHAAVACAGRTVYAGRGHCASFGDAHLV